MKIMKLHSLALSMYIILLLTSPLISTDQPPNVILIFADDLGYGDLGCYGATKVQTPNIDRLANEGRRFTDAHSVSAVCTPSRYALLTGEYPIRANGGKGLWGPAPITSPLLINSQKLTIADVFKRKSYKTAIIGKWHLGFKKGSNDWQVPLRPGPQDLGFDYYFGMPVVNSAPPYVYVENDQVVGGDPADPLVLLNRRNNKNATPITKIPPEAAQRTPNFFKGAVKAHKLYNDYQVGTKFANKSVEWIEKNKDKPFFLYLATTNIHHPFTPAKRFQGTSQCGLYGDYIHELDWMVGKILSSLEDNGLTDNTLVIFTSDNGGMFNLGGQNAFKAGHRINGDLLGFKFGAWEGGHRVPLIARWPGKIKAGSTSNQLIGHVDLLATIAAVTGQELGRDQLADSVNMLPALLGDPKNNIRDHLLLAPRRGTHLSVRKGKWMYIPRRGSGGFGGRKPGSHGFSGPAAASFVGSVNSDIKDGKIKKNAPPAQLYDLESDVKQSKNVFKDHPNVIQQMEALLNSYRSKKTDESAPKKRNTNIKKPSQNPLNTPKKQSDTKPKSGKKPNFVVIFTDDQGYGDLSCFGGKHVSTPRIDQMAKEGSRLTSFYVGAPVCTPSRAALMTGSYPKRIDMAMGSNFGVLLAGDKKGLNPKEITIAEILKSVGYKTGIFGKWHLGDQPEFLPTNQGFDEFFGIPYSHDIHPHHPRQNHYKFPPLALLENEKVIEMDPDADFLTKRITERAVSFIEKNKDEPFFLYVPHPIPHAPIHASPPFMEGVSKEVLAKLKKEDGNIDYTTRHQLFPQAISEIDKSVGRILDTLKTHGLDENTLVLFTTDNGPPKNTVFANAGPLRGHKGTTFEGGMRVPTVVHWPNKIPAGKTNDELMTTMDLLPTFAELAGASIPKDRIIDGKNIWSTLTGKAKTPHESLFYHRGNRLQAVRSGRWKLHTNKGKPSQLYNLESDIGEKRNVIQAHPEIVNKLDGYLKSFAKDIAANSRPAAYVKNPIPLSIQKEISSPSHHKRNASSEASTKPNFIVIFADDLGYGDISCYRPDGVKTPHIDKLATEGFRSTDFFVPANVCSPSRAALLTGRYPMRCGMPVARNENVLKYKDYGFPGDELTIPELLKPAGYRSLMVGKWHLGMEVEGSHPLDAGFDEHLGIPSNYEKKRGKNYKTLYRGRKVEQQNVPCQILTKRYTDEVVSFIQRQKDKPFFIYVSHHIVHSPFLPRKEFIGSSKKGKYGDFIKELDHSTGRIMKAIRESGIEKNTLVVFTSDNGPTFRGSTGGLNGGKYGTMEGGHRVPGIFWWPGQIPSGQVSKTTISSMDLLPLFCRLAGVNSPSDRKIDGANIFPILQGNETQSPHRFLYYYNGTNLQAVREGKWKLHLPRTPMDQPFWSKRPIGGRVFVTLKERQLFNLENDVREKTNVADHHPKIVARLLKQAKTIRAELGDVRMTGTDQKKIKLVDPQER